MVIYFSAAIYIASCSYNNYFRTCTSNYIQLHLILSKTAQTSTNTPNRKSMAIESPSITQSYCSSDSMSELCIIVNSFPNFDRCYHDSNLTVSSFSWEYVGTQ